MIKFIQFNGTISNIKYIVLSFIFCNCVNTREVILYSSYHPYVATRLCPLTISGELSSIRSISILLNHENVYDAEGQVVKESGIHVERDAEYMLPLKIDLQKGFFYQIPCRNQTIRIRYLLDGSEKYLDINFDRETLKNLSIRKRAPGVLYVEG